MLPSDFVSTFSVLLKPIVLPPRRELSKSDLATRQALTALVSHRTLVKFAAADIELIYNFDPWLRTILKIAAGFDIPIFCGDVCFRSVLEFLNLARETIGSGATRIGESINRNRQQVDRSIHSPGIRIQIACALAEAIEKPMRLVLPPGLIGAATQYGVHEPESRVDELPGRTLSRAKPAPMLGVPLSTQRRMV